MHRPALVIPTALSVTAAMGHYPYATIPVSAPRLWTPTQACRRRRAAVANVDPTALLRFAPLLLCSPMAAAPLTILMLWQGCGRQLNQRWRNAWWNATATLPMQRALGHQHC